MRRTVAGSVSRQGPAGAMRGLALGLVLLLLQACRGGASPRQVTLEFWAFGREGEVVQSLIAEFEQRNPGVRVRVQQVPFTAAHEKLLTAFVGESTPDVAQLGNTWVPEFAALGAIEALDGRLGASGIQREDYFPGIWDSNVVEGRTFGIPWYVDTRLLFYRKDILAQAGIPAPPRTWQEWESAMARICSGGGPKRYAILLPIDEWNQPVIFALQAGAGLLKEQGGRGDFRSEAFRKGLGFYVGMFQKGYAPPLSNTQVSNVYQQFASGEFPLYITGPWNIGEFKRRLPAELQGRWATAPLPSPSKDGPWPGASLAGGASLVLFQSSRHREEAFRLIEFLSDAERQKAFFRLSGDLPPRKSAWADPLLAEDAYAAAFRIQLERVLPTPKVPEWDRITAKIYEHAETVIRGRASLDEAVAALDRDADRILEKRRWLQQRAGGKR